MLYIEYCGKTRVILKKSLVYTSNDLYIALEGKLKDMNNTHDINSPNTFIYYTHTHTHTHNTHTHTHHTHTKCFQR